MFLLQCDCIHCDLLFLLLFHCIHMFYCIIAVVLLFTCSWLLVSCNCSQFYQQLGLFQFSVIVIYLLVVQYCQLKHIRMFRVLVGLLICDLCYVHVSCYVIVVCVQLLFIAQYFLFSKVYVCSSVLLQQYHIYLVLAVQFICVVSICYLFGATSHSIIQYTMYYLVQYSILCHVILYTMI